MISARTVDGVDVQMDMRVTDPNAHLVGMVGADWWRDASAPFLPDHSTSPGIGGTNWVELSTQWQTLGYEHRAISGKFAASAPRICSQHERRLEFHDRRNVEWQS